MCSSHLRVVACYIMFSFSCFVVPSSKLFLIIFSSLVYQHFWCMICSYVYYVYTGQSPRLYLCCNIRLVYFARTVLRLFYVDSLHQPEHGASSIGIGRHRTTSGGGCGGDGGVCDGQRLEKIQVNCSPVQRHSQYLRLYNLSYPPTTVSNG